MIDISLSEQPVDLSKFEVFEEKIPCLFLGYAIKNEYDNQRLHINKKHSPKRYTYVFTKKDDTMGILPLYGLFLQLNQTGLQLIKILNSQESKGNLNINLYSTIISGFGLSCNDSYSYLNKKIYPFDLQHFKNLTTSELKTNNKIFQDLIDISEEDFDFQKFGSLKLLILN